MTVPRGPILASGQQISDADLVEKKREKRAFLKFSESPCGEHAAGI
jgi:hypothetical protein